MNSGDSDAPVMVLGSRGMVGSAIVRALEAAGQQAIEAHRGVVDLTDRNAVHVFFAEHKPAQVYVAAARVGGIVANRDHPVDFLLDNLRMQNNALEAAHACGVDRLLFLGSSCIYPKLAGQPMAEDSLLTGALEPTNEPYAIAKIAGIKLCESYNRQYGTDFRSLMPTNLYGPGDNFNLEGSHVIPALMRKCHEAKLAGAAAVSVWGSGNPRREFLHVDDLAKACVHMMELPREAYWATVPQRESHINIGTGQDVTIRELAELIASVVGFTGALEFDASQPDGTPRKLLDVSRASALGWQAATQLEDGLATTYAWFLENQSSVRS
ncbi:GDP-L-fucose synthase [bacterium]|nr:GDP-L-fucose synthase [bacterium]